MPLQFRKRVKKFLLALLAKNNPKNGAHTQFSSKCTMYIPTGSSGPGVTSRIITTSITMKIIAAMAARIFAPNDGISRPNVDKD